MKSLSISNKILIFTAGCLLLFTSIFLYLINSQIHKNYVRLGRDFNLSVEQLFDLGLHDHMLNCSDKSIDKIFEIMLKNRKLENIRIVEPNGIISHSNNKEEDKQFIWDILKNVQPIKLDTISSRARLEIDEARKLYFRPIKNQKECFDCHGNEPVIAYVNTQMNYGNNLAEIRNTYYQMAAIGILFSLLIFIGLYIIIRKLFVNRLNLFHKGIAKVEGGDMDHKFKIDKWDEIGTLENHFNIMLDKLKESKQNEKELYLEQLKNLDKLVTIGELTAGIAHEINNYAAILLSRIDYLRSEFENRECCGVYMEDIDVIHKQILSLSAITKNILKHAKQNKNEFTQNNIKTIILNATKFISHSIKKRNVKLIVEDIPDVELKSNETQLEQVFVNLFTNALDAIASEGYIEIKGSLKKNKLFITVSDNGWGIKPEDMDNIFMPFFTTKTGAKASGIGLYIVDKILKQHNAKIRCNSEYGKGTTFEIEFELENE